MLRKSEESAKCQNTLEGKSHSGISVPMVGLCGTFDTIENFFDVSAEAFRACTEVPGT